MKQIRSFDIIYESTQREGRLEKKESMDYWCDVCKRNKIMDHRNYHYVCEKCGMVSNNNELKVKYGFPSRNTELIYNKPYSRYFSFCQYINKQYYIDESIKKLLKNMFLKFEKEFNTVCKHRKKFIMYDYVIIKFLVVLNQKQLIHHFKFPKTTLTIKKYEVIWSTITQKLNWSCK